jgi:hypothetical protein
VRYTIVAATSGAAMGGGAVSKMHVPPLSLKPELHFEHVPFVAKQAAQSGPAATVQQLPRHEPLAHCPSKLQTPPGGRIVDGKQKPS